MVKHGLGKCISVTYRFSQIYYDKQSKKYNLCSGQQFLLLVVKEHPGISQYELSVKGGFDKGTVAKGVKKLVGLGYLDREVCHNDKRINKLFVTEAGEEVIEFTKKTIGVWEEIILEGLNEEERERTFICLEKISQNAIGYIKRERDLK